ncbi:MAG: hypothetical protein C3F08_00450 [Candidatus Methylomirabilota bacterium]|nr:MAG: hypothetical protein C3F08_00450 [candidate division NC10 bacterium]
MCVTSYVLGDDAASWRALNIARSLCDAGYRVTVRQYVRPEKLVTGRRRALEIPGVSFEIAITSRLGSILRHGWDVTRKGFDLVIGNNINGGLFSILGCLSTPLVLDMHGNMVAELEMEHTWDGGSSVLDIEYRFRRVLYQLADVTTRRIADRVLCVSRAMMRELGSRGVQEKKLVYVPNCVDLQFFRPRPMAETLKVRRDLGIDDDKFLVGYLGRLQSWQGYEKFLEAARNMGDPRLSFLIVGGDESGADDTLHFVRSVPVDRMPSLYGACNLLVLPRPDHPATRVAAPTKFAEYAAMGKPILTTNVGDAADFVKAYACGLVVEDCSAPELTRGIREMLSRSRHELAEMGHSSRHLAEAEFNLEVARKSLSGCVESLVGR